MTKKFVEIEGKKYQADDNGEVIKDENGNHIPFVEDTPPADTEESLEELAKKNPAVAKLLADKIEADRIASEREAEESQRRQKELEAKGEWEKLAKEKDREIERLKEDDKKKSELLGKYKGSVEGILNETLKTVPKDKLSLIPAEFSPRQKLEYITKNAKLLGVSLVKAGDKIEKNDADPNNLTDEAKVRKELNDLIAKGKARTPKEDEQMIQLSRKLKEISNSKK